MFPLAVILGMAAFGNDRRGAIYALPLGLGGAAVAGYHSALVAGWVPQWWIPCGAGPSCSDQKLVILGDIQIPWLSLLAFTVIVAFLLAYLRKTRA
jgi:disulfide bond formation protein DsbB